MKKEEKAVFSAQDFFVETQGILSSDFLALELEAQVLKSVDNGSFLIRNEKCVNAYAYKENQRNIVAISAGSVYKCLYAANLFMLKDDFLPDVGDENACFHSVIASDYPLIEGENMEMSFYESGDVERRNIGQIITALALKFMVYHEIGHHVCGHLTKLNEAVGLNYGEMYAESHNLLTNDEFRKIETEADLFSVERIMGELDELSRKWSPFFEVELGHLELVQLLTVALVIVKESLTPELDPVRDCEQGRYWPKLIRLVVNISTAFLGDQLQLCSELRGLLELDPNTKVLIEEYIGKFSMDKHEDIVKALCVFMSVNIVSAEQIYMDLFYGRHDPILFRPDILIAEWWKKLRGIYEE